MIGPPSPTPSALVGVWLTSRLLSAQQIYIPLCLLIVQNRNTVTKTENKNKRKHNKQFFNNHNTHYDHTWYTLRNLCNAKMHQDWTRVFQTNKQKETNQLTGWRQPHPPTPMSLHHWCAQKIAGQTVWLPQKTEFKIKIPKRNQTSIHTYIPRLLSSTHRGRAKEIERERAWDFFRIS
jgi:hypothetical protein